MIINLNMFGLFVEFTIEKSERGNVHTKMFLYNLFFLYIGYRWGQFPFPKNSLIIVYSNTFFIYIWVLYYCADIVIFEKDNFMYLSKYGFDGYIEMTKDW